MSTVTVRHTCGHDVEYRYATRADYELYRRWSTGPCSACIPRSVPSEQARKRAQALEM